MASESPSPMNSSHYFQRFFACLLIIATLVVVFVSGQHFTIADTATSLTALFCAILIFYVTDGSDPAPKRVRLKASYLALFSFMVLLVVMWRYFAFGLWLDELSQYYNIDQAARGFTLARSAADQQQPSLDLYFQLLADQIFAPGEFALRIFPFIFFVGAILQLKETIGLITRHSSLVALGLTLFLLNPAIQYYSLEARPYSLAVMLGLSFFNRLYQYQANPSEKNLLALFCFSALLVTAIGFQPPIIIGVGFLLLVLKKSIDWNSSVWRGGAVFLILITAMIYWPILSGSLAIDKIGLSQMNSGADVDLWRKVLRAPLSREYGGIYNVVMSILIVVSIIVMLINCARKKIQAYELSYLLLVATLTGLSFQFIINWPYFEKFSLISFPLAIILVVRQLDVALNHVEKYKHSYRAVSGVLVFLPLIIFLYSFSIERTQIGKQRENWRSFKHEMDKLRRPTVVGLSFLDPYLPPIYAIMGDKVYFDSQRIEVVDGISFPKYKRNVTAINSVKDKSQGELVIAMPKTWSHDSIDPRLVNAWEQGMVMNESLFRYWISDDGNASAESFLRGVAWFYAGQPWSFSVLETLLVFYSREKNINMTLQVENEMWNLIHSHNENENLGVKNLNQNKAEYFRRYFDELKNHVR